MEYASLMPKKRTRLRIFLGIHFYTLKRRLFWLFGGMQFARTKESQSYRFTYYNHSTPLLRHLRDVDMSTIQ